MRNLLFIIYIALFSPLSSNAQLIADTTSNTSGLAKALSYYIGAVGINASIYSGGENGDPRYPVNDGFSFYGRKEAVASDVLYDGILYRGIPMWYDIVHNEVAVQHPAMNARIALKNNKVSYFMLGDDPFVPVNREWAGSEVMPEGFYRVIYGGKATLLGHYSKRMFEIIQESQYVTNFSKQQSEYFLEKNGRYEPVKTLGALLNLLADKKQELQQHLREFDQEQKSNKVKIKETPEQSMVRVLEFYDKISL